VRLSWRFADLEQLADEVGVQLDVDRWKGLLAAAMGRTPKGK